MEAHVRTSDPAAVRRPAWPLLAALFLGLAVRLAWLASVDTQPVTDFAWYFDRAVEMASGGRYAVNGEPTAYWPVGYPGFLAASLRLFGPTVEVAKAMNTVLTLASMVFAWAIARRVSPYPVVANVTAFALAIHPSYVAYSGILASEPLFTTLVLAAGAGCLLCPRRGAALLALAGLAFGCATLVRPQAVALPFVLLAAARYSANRGAFKGVFWPTLIAICLVVALTLTPWTLRNAATFDRFVFVSTNGGDNLLIGHHAEADGGYRNPEAIEPRLRGLPEPERDQLARNLAIQALREDPARSFALVPTKIAKTFAEGSDVAYWAFQTNRGRLTVPGMGSDKALFLATRQVSGAVSLGLAWLLAGSLAVGFGAGLVALWPNAPARALAMRPPMVPVVSLAYTAALSACFFGNPRFGFSAVPFAVMVVAHVVAAALAPPTAAPRSS